VSSRLVVNHAALKTRAAQIGPLLERIEAALQ
jgi:hypothetical protein